MQHNVIITLYKHNKGVNRMKEFICQMCGNKFNTTANRASYCPECRKQRQLERAKTYNQKIKNCEKTRTIGELEICPECGNTYILKSGSQKVCENCRKKHTNQKKIKPNSEYKAKNYDTCIFYVKKGEKQGIQEYAEKNGMSLNELVNLSIKTFMENNKENNK